MLLEVGIGVYDRVLYWLKIMILSFFYNLYLNVNQTLVLSSVYLVICSF